MPLKKAFFLSLLLTVLKLVGFYLSGSMIVLASFYDSFTDSLISYLNYIFYRKAREKADLQHPFGHGGFEVVSSLIQGFMISTLGLLLAYQTVIKLIKNHANPLDPHSFPFVLGIMLLSTVSGYGIQWYLGRHEKDLADLGEASLTISSDRAHYMSDVYTNGLGAIGIVSVYMSGSHTLDSLLGLVGAGFLFKTAWPLLKDTFTHIMHVEAEPDVQKEILSIALATDHLVEGIHRLRTRRMGPNLFIDFHLKLPAYMPLADAHDLGDRVEDSIKAKYPRADVLIHLDPDNVPDEDI